MADALDLRAEKLLLELDFTEATHLFFLSLLSGGQLSRRVGKSCLQRTDALGALGALERLPLAGPCPCLCQTEAKALPLLASSL